MPEGSGAVTGGSLRHVVHFYRRDGELCGAVARYLAGAVTGGGVAVMAATAAHRAMLCERLADLGVDVPAARRTGALVSVDAAGAVARFAAAGEMDPAAFDAEIAGVVRRAAARGGPVRVFGEMVTLLWDAGHVNAALELEERWNALRREVPFALYCAYPERSVAPDAHRDALTEVRRLHEAVVTPPPARASPARAGRVGPGPPPWAAAATAARAFPADRNAPRAARHFVTETLRRWQACEVVDDAAIVVTELAANAVIHAGTGFTVSLAGRGDAVRISVGDAAPLASAGTGAPLPAAPSHGLGVVSAVADAWGAQPAAGGKTVWAELRRR